MNRVELIGNLGGDPEVFETQFGQGAKFSVATSYKTKEGEITDWHKVVIFGDEAKVAGDVLKKGMKVHIRGALKPESWKNEQGENQYSYSIKCFEFRLVEDGVKQEELPASEEVMNNGIRQARETLEGVFNSTGASFSEVRS